MEWYWFKFTKLILFVQIAIFSSGKITDPGEGIELRFILKKSELFRVIPESVSEPIRETFCISFDEIRSKINQIQSEESIRIIPTSDSSD